MEPVELKLRRLRVSLRVLMLLIMIAAVFIGDRVTKARKQREAVESVKRCGGGVVYDWAYVNRGKSTPTEPNAPQWLRGLLGDEYFQDVASVALTGTPIGVPVPGSKVISGDDVLAHLAQMNAIKSLHLVGIRITDKGFDTINRIQCLEELVIARSPWVSNADIARIETLNHLKSISIENSKVTDAGLASLAKLKNLEYLNIQNTGATDAGLVYLKGLTKLKEMWVEGTRITEDGKAEFNAAMPNLKVIR
ncbi:hypothetical protein SAMN05444166_1082 [Singulisphaera sp. GP187]|uniref:leucine-rich repeat domain-containing protein n=1 Tax=Singulisphaera sp. GP187 TaxID=1882752 RepID=UPI00092CD27C|nr:leucine-rich repeat domain-containing protein [Singulisphaera sp. GP187]SIN81955.1 hypothetical protein SAMN05444166_1082 [Singulisphaera sp. GP187]